jgi:hypothetical protein
VGEGNKTINKLKKIVNGESGGWMTLVRRRIFRRFY